MIRTIRMMLALLCCLLLAGLIGLSGSGKHADKEPPVASSARMTNQDCRSCHEAVFSEWQSSYHARAYSDDAVQAAFKHFGFDRNCESCHAPQPILMTNVSQPVLRNEDLQTGVNCLSCHAMADNQVAARRTVDAPCRPVGNASLIDGSACGACHVAIYKDWLTSAYAGQKSCQDCHMPALAMTTGRHSHACLGSHDDSLVKSGVEMLCQQQGGELVVRVKNQATGHNFPGERHNRVLLLQVIERSQVGEITLAQQELIKGITPFRGESSAERIRAGESFEARFVLMPPSTVEVKLLYKQFPWFSDRDALVIADQSVETLTP